MNESVPVESLTIPLPSWRSHKVVQALKIAAIIPNPRGFELHFEDRRFCPIEVQDFWVAKQLPSDKDYSHLVGGYLVVYPDNYRSWSPAAAFEAGYTPVHGAGIAADAQFGEVSVQDWAARLAAERGELTTGLVQPAEPPKQAEHSWFSQAALDVTAERRRQIEVEGWDPESDDNWVGGELSALAALYAMPDGAREWPTEATGYGATLGDAMQPDGWIVNFSHDRRRNLVKAAALLLAEIERLDRAAAAGGDA